MTSTKYRVLVFVASVSGVFLSALAVAGYFFVANRAPILQGNVGYHIPYKQGKTLDIYEPTHRAYDQAPVLIYFHGGAWMVGRKEAINMNRFNGAINTLRANGYCIISPDYELASERSPFPDCIIDAYDVLAWLERHADEYHLDLNNVGVLGESAGAHIAMMLAFGYREQSTGQPGGIRPRYLIDVYGPSDLDMLYHGPTKDTLDAYLGKLPATLQKHLDPTQKLFGFDPKEDSLKAAAFMYQYSPITYVCKNAPPVLMIHGTADRVVPVEHSTNLRHVLEDLRIDHQYYELDQVDHAFINASKAQSDSVQTWLSSFVKAHYSE